MQTLTCADARHYIHLTVGDDTFAEEESRLSEHLHQCSDCRSYHSGMLDSMRVIERTRDEEVEIPRGSLWPAMASQLKVRQAQQLQPVEGRRFNSAVIALCVCSMVLAIVTAVRSLPANTPQVANYPGYTLPSTTNVNFSQTAMPSYPVNNGARLIEVQGPNGEKLLVDPETQRYYVPHFLNTSDSNLNF